MIVFGRLGNNRPNKFKGNSKMTKTNNLLKNGVVHSTDGETFKPNGGQRITNDLHKKGA